MSVKKILIISESIAPVQAVASIRWTKFAKYLARMGEYHVTILTNRKDFSGEQKDCKRYAFDASSLDDLRDVDVEYISLTAFQRVSNRLYNAVSERLAALRGSTSVSSRGDKPRRGAVVAVLELLLVVADWMTGKALGSSSRKMLSGFSDIDYVISTYGPRWPHQVARDIRERYRRVRWIADFRDPAVTSDANDNPLSRSYADRMTRTADCVIGVSGGTISNLLLHHGQRTKVITNGFDVEDSAARAYSASDACMFVYTGTLYADGICLRDITPLFRALDELIAEGAIDAENVQVVYAGTTSNLFLQAASNYPQVPSRSLGLLKRSDALALQQRASALVVCTWNTEYQKGVLTGKVFEYMRSGVPIIGLCSGDVSHSDLREIIEECQVGFCYEEADEDGFQELKEKILALYDSWRRNGYTELPSASRRLVMRYSYPELTKELSKLLT